MLARPIWSSLWCVTLTVGFLILGAPSDGAAQEKPPQSENVENYEGVIPGSGNNLPRIVELRGKKGTWVTWPGFMMLPGGGSRVFLQTTDALKYKVTESPEKIVVRIDRAKIFLSNNKNPLVTTYFDTPLRRTDLRAQGRNVELTLFLKVPAVPVIRQVSDEDGYNYLFIDFTAQSVSATNSAPKTSD